MSRSEGRAGDAVLGLRGRAGWRARLRGWCERHLQSLFFALGQLAAQPLGSALTCLVIGVALALPAGLHLAVSNLSRAAQGWEGGVEMSLFLRAGVGAREAAALAREIASRPDVTGTRVISPREALDDLARTAGFGESLDLLGEDNPLPFVIVVGVDPKRGTRAATTALAERLRDREEVEAVQIDLEWLERLQALAALLERTVVVVAVSLALGVLLVVGNTIRVGIDARREEIQIARLFGATNAFVRRPFLYGGLLFGLGGAFAAWAMVEVAALALAGPAQRLAALYASDLRLRDLGPAETAALLGAGAVLGLVGAAVAVTRHLREAGD